MCGLPIRPSEAARDLSALSVQNCVIACGFSVLKVQCNLLIGLMAGLITDFIFRDPGSAKPLH